MKRQLFAACLAIGFLVIPTMRASAQSDREYNFTFDIQANAKNDINNPEPPEKTLGPVKFTLKDEKDQRKSRLYDPCDYTDIKFDGGFSATIMGIGLKTLVPDENGLSLSEYYAYRPEKGVIAFGSCKNRYYMGIYEANGIVILIISYTEATENSVGYWLATSEPNEANLKELRRMQKAAQNNAFHGFKRATE